MFLSKKPSPNLFNRLAFFFNGVKISTPISIKKGLKSIFTKGEKDF